MAINPESQYPGKITPSTPSYPYGSARNVTVPGDGTGTPWEAALVNDLFGFQQAILARAGVVPNGTPDNATASQYLDALLNVVGTRSYNTIALMVADESLAAGNKVITFDENRFETWNVAVSGDVALDNGLFATRTQSRIYSTLATLKADDSLKVGETAFTFFSGDEKGKNDRQLYRIMDLSSPVTNGPLADDAQIIALNSGLYAVSVQTMGDSNVPFSLSRLNMHFSVMKGIPWNASEAGGSDTYTTNANANPGDMSLSLTSSAGLVADQLICYRADDGQYYTTVIESISVNVLTLRSPIEATMNSGGNVHNFYINFSHANPFGFYAITDYALRELTHTYRKVAEVAHDEWGPLIGPETLTLTTDEDIYAPGSSNNEYLRVTTSGGADEGVVSNGFYELPEGLYLIRGYINPGSVNAGADLNEVQLAVSQTINSTAVTQTVANDQRKGQDATQSYEFFYYAANDSTQRLTCRSRLAVAGEFEMGKVEIFRVENTFTNMDNSKHVMLGDSWFDFGDIQDRITDRLPNAVIFEEGVGGNRANQLVARFDADCAAHKPDYVWIMCGTNDYFGNVSLDTFEFNMNVLKEKIAAIGATAIFFDPSVGEIDNGSFPHNFDVSRTYALRGSYSQAAAQQKPQGSVEGVERVQFFVDQSIPASSTALVYMPPGTTQKGYDIIRSFFNSSSFNVKAGFRSTIGAPNEDVITYAANTLVQPSSPQSVSVPSGGTRFLAIGIENTTGGALTCTGYIEVEYTPTV